MNNPHSFYRFGSAWNTGFYPQNQIASNQLNDIHVAIQAWLPTFSLGDSFSQLKQGIQNIVNPFNQFPVLGNFRVFVTTTPDPPFTDYAIYIQDDDLRKTDTSQYVLVYGQYNTSTKAVASKALLSFTAGAYSGTFDSAHVPMEDEAINALKIVNDYGSAIMPLVYSYDQNTGIATSVLARASSYQLSNGAIARIPADTAPKLNARRFTLPALSAEDKFAVTFMEQIINASIGQTDTTAISNAYNSLVMPDGWVKNYIYNATTYPRVQVTLENTNGTRVFALVGRFDVSWSWQRFVNDISENDSSFFISSYSPTTQLPYEPTSGSRYIYFDTWYDFDFCDFVQDCYVSPEFYAMPAIPGDIYQFNVPPDSGNLTGLTNVEIGLFEEDGGFVQRIGSGELQQWNCVTPFCLHSFVILLTESEFTSYVNNINDNLPSGFPPSFVAYLWRIIPDSGDQIVIGSSVFSNFTDPFTNAEMVNLIRSLGLDVTIDDDGNYVISVSYNLPCGKSYLLRNYLSTGETLLESESFECVCDNPVDGIQFYCTATIPAVADGCYRFGLYTNVESQFHLYSLSNIINIDRADCFSTMLEFWSDDNTIAEGFEYINGWKQKVRIGLNGGGEKPVIEENLYRQSNGVHKRPQNKQDLSLDLHTDFFDLDTQLAMTDATRHPYLVWSGKPIFVKGDIEVATTQDFTTQSSFETLSQMKFQALLQGFQPRNSSCLNC